MIPPLKCDPDKRIHGAKLAFIFMLCFSYCHPKKAYVINSAFMDEGFDRAFRLDLFVGSQGVYRLNIYCSFTPEEFPSSGGDR